MNLDPNHIQQWESQLQIRDFKTQHERFEFLKTIFTIKFQDQVNQGLYRRSLFLAVGLGQSCPLPNCKKDIRYFHKPEATNNFQVGARKSMNWGKDKFISEALNCWAFCPPHRYKVYSNELSFIAQYTPELFRYFCGTEYFHGMALPIRVQALITKAIYSANNPQIMRMEWLNTPEFPTDWTDRGRAYTQRTNGKYEARFNQILESTEPVADTRHLTVQLPIE